MTEELKNKRAWSMLDEALFTSSHVKAEDVDAGETDWDNVYPTSAEETDRMEELLNKAAKAADDPNETNFRRRMEELRDVVSWSRKRHRTWKWQLILGSLIATAVFWYYKGENESDQKKAEALVSQVKAWAERDTIVPFENVPMDVNYSQKYISANLWQLNELARCKRNIASYEKSVKDYAYKADTAKTEEKKKLYRNSMDEATQKVADYRKEYRKFEEMKFADIKETALEEVKGRADRQANTARSTFLWLLFLIILIPLYVITGYSYGYVMSCHRRQANVLDKIQRWGFAVAAFFFGTGFAMSLIPDDVIRVKWSDGREETRAESNPANFIIIALKIGLMIVGAFIFSFISVLIMTVETVTGLKRNFNWQPLLNKIKKEQTS